MEAITKQRWQHAQQEERKMHGFTRQEGLEHYEKAYNWNFHYCKVQRDQGGKSILEIGPADFPALYFCHNYKGTVIEPMPSAILEDLCLEKDIRIIRTPVEETILPLVDEIWIFNVMQHVIDPVLFIAKCKEAAEVVRFFEPIDYPTCDYHPHTFSERNFRDFFGDAVQLYTEFQPGFHDAICVYGVWEKQKHGGGLNQWLVVKYDVQFLRAPEVWTRERYNVHVKRSLAAGKLPDVSIVYQFDL